MHTFMKLILFS